MSSENGASSKLALDGCGGQQEEKDCSLQKFKLYETQSKFYMIGRDKSRTRWRVLKIDRLEPSELIINEDPVTYTPSECHDLLQRINEGNRSTGGLMLVTKCYGIVGFIKFLEPYYMILITKRRQIGNICGHTIYGISESQIISVPHSTALTNLAYCKDEQRYKKLLSTVDLTKDFFFSYTYHIMCSLQKNLTEVETSQMLYERLFVWNEFLTRGIRHCLNNTWWTVALVYGFLKQAKLTIHGKAFCLTLVARRSRHYAGTRYLKRGVNDKGRVANDVETEQIVFEDDPKGCPGQISSVVQHRGSIPLFWSQEASRLSLKPDIILHKRDPTYQATRQHFENLVKRYGNPIIVLNLIKKYERKPREAKLCAEFANAIEYINSTLCEESRLKFIHWDFHKFSRSKSANVLAHLEHMAVEALHLTGFFYSGIISDLKMEPNQAMEVSKKDDAGKGCSSVACSEPCTTTDNGISTCTRNVEKYNSSDALGAICEKNVEKRPLFQKGVLRTNCIDCLDRTNVAQYVYGLAALGRQLNALGLLDAPKIDPDSRLGEALMGLYENMGDTLALQYGGSAAHNKVFSERRGRWKATTHSQEFFRTLQRYYRNAYLDAEKQDAINVFLGHFQPQQGKPALWELNSDQNCNIGCHLDDFVNKNLGPSFKRSLSDGSMLVPNIAVVSAPTLSQNDLQVKLSLAERPIKVEGSNLTTENAMTHAYNTSYARFLQSVSHRRLFNNCEMKESIPRDKIIESGQQGMVDGSTNTEFIDFDWLASSGNSCEEDSTEGCSMVSTLERKLSPTNNTVNSAIAITEGSIEDGQTSQGTNGMEITDEPSKPGVQGMKTVEESASEDSLETEHSLEEAMIQAALAEFSSNFVQWVNYGQTLCN